MSIAITLELNGVREIKEVSNVYSVRDLLAALNIRGVAEARVNGVDGGVYTSVSHGDFIQITAVAVAPATPVVPGGKALFINNDGGGFADSVSFAAGTTLEQFLEDRDVSVENKLVRVNNGLAEATYVLRDGDKISVTPLKVEGAVDMIKVLYVNNDGSGFAESVQVILGVTLFQFLAQQGASPEGKLVRLNNDIAAGTTPLKNGDKISVTPLKVEGAGSRN